MSSNFASVVRFEGLQCGVEVVAVDRAGSAAQDDSVREVVVGWNSLRPIQRHKADLAIITIDCNAVSGAGNSHKGHLALRVASGNIIVSGNRCKASHAGASVNSQ